MEPESPLRRILTVVFALLAIASFSGCATAGRVLSFSGYRADAAKFRSSAASGNPSTVLAAADWAREMGGRGDAVLYALEEGRLRALAGDLDGSTRSFQQAVDLFEEERTQPVVRASEGFFSATAIATNDRALPYESAGFERLMAHNLLALNYLRQEKPDLAQVTLNGAIAEMDYLREKQSALENAEVREANRGGVAMNSVAGATSSTRTQLRATARPELSPYQNAFTFFLSSALFEIQGDHDRARIAMRRAGELYPEHPDIVGVLEHGWRSKGDDALIIVLVADGWVSLKETVGLPFIWDGTILQVVMPIYGDHLSRWGAGGSQWRIDGNQSLTPTIISDLDSQARQDLADRYPAIFLRQVLRLVAKYQIQQRLGRENPWAGLAAQVFNILTDHADLRSWSTLPGSLQVAHTELPAGRHRISGAANFPPIEMDLPPGSTLFLILDQSSGAYVQDWVLFDSNGQAMQSDASPHPQSDSR